MNLLTSPCSNARSGPNLVAKPGPAGKHDWAGLNGKINAVEKLERIQHLSQPFRLLRCLNCIKIHFCEWSRSMHKVSFPTDFHKQLSWGSHAVLCNQERSKDISQYSSRIVG